MSSHTFQPDPNDHELVAFWADQDRKQRKQPQQQQSAEQRFIRRLTVTRLEQGMAQVILAQKAGIPQSALARIESGKGNPTLKTLAKLADAMGYQLTMLRKPD